MIFNEIREDKGWTIVDYNSTWKYGYDFMLDAAQAIIDTDFQDDLQRVAVSSAAQRECLDEVRRADNDLRKCPITNQECGTLIISGFSRIMECPVQFMFFNQTNLVRLCSPSRKYFDDNGNDVFNNYLNSVEIRAYCKDTERKTIERLSDK